MTYRFPPSRYGLATGMVVALAAALVLGACGGGSGSRSARGSPYASASL
ncbi:MAG: hypothetical protein HKM95_06905, partial [Inquilinus sp.]|nr:hypothetical protein [Inquilinus sp.]